MDNFSDAMMRIKLKNQDLTIMRDFFFHGKSQDDISAEISKAKLLKLITDSCREMMALRCTSSYYS